MNKLPMALFSLLLINVLPAGAAEERGLFAATIKSLDGSAWVSNCVSGGMFKLDPAGNLFENHQVKCEPGSKLVLRLRYGSLTAINSTNWTAVPLEPNPFENDPDRRTLAKQISEGMQPAGASRSGGTDSTIIRPAGNSFIRPGQKLVVEWIPSAGSKTLNLQLAEGLDGFRCQTNIPSSTGAVEFPEWLQSRALPDPQSGHRKLVLTYGFDADPSNTLQFEILPADRNDRLEAKLQQTGMAYQNDQVRLHVARAGIFHEYKLLNDCADEYLQALACPGEDNSIDLLECARAALEEIGDFQKADELRQRLRHLGVNH